jgi:FKBP-type peptidyl-prolyl cis-trans isomerase
MIVHMKNIILGLFVIGIIVLSGLLINSFFGYVPSNAEKTAATASPAASEKVKMEDLKVGTGKEVKPGDTISVNYKGTLTNGKQFDSSYDRNTPFETKIGVGAVIKGWDEGIVGMKVGGKRKLTIPPSLGYGSAGAGSSIPPNSTLIFEVELLSIK